MAQNLRAYFILYVSASRLFFASPPMERVTVSPPPFAINKAIVYKIVHVYLFPGPYAPLYHCIARPTIKETLLYVIIIKWITFMQEKI